MLDVLKLLRRHFGIDFDGGVPVFLRGFKVGSEHFPVSELSALATERTYSITGALGDKRLCEMTLQGDVQESTGNSVAVLGVNNTGAQVEDEDCELHISGIVDCIAAQSLSAGVALKSYYGGRVGPVLLPYRTGVAVAENVTGAAFTNQPGGAAVEVVSDNANDTNVGIEIIGRVGGVIHSEVVNTDSTDPVGTAAQTSRSDWDAILAIKAQGSRDGTIVVRLTGDTGDIATIASGAESAGVVDLTGSESSLYGSTPELVADGPSSAYVGVNGVLVSDGIVETQAVQLDGTTRAPSSGEAMARANELYVGEVANDVDVALYPSATPDSPSVYCGRAKSSASAIGDTVKATIQ